MIEQMLKIIDILSNLTLAAAIVTFICLVILLYLGYKAHSLVREGADLPEGSKPCRFCGSHNLKVQRLLGKYNVVCCDCNVDGPSYNTLQDAIEAWNWEDEDV